MLDIYLSIHQIVYILEQIQSVHSEKLCYAWESNLKSLSQTRLTYHEATLSCVENKLSNGIYFGHCIRTSLVHLGLPGLGLGLPLSLSRQCGVFFLSRRFAVPTRKPVALRATLATCNRWLASNPAGPTVASPCLPGLWMQSAWAKLNLRNLKNSFQFLEAPFLIVNCAMVNR